MSSLVRRALFVCVGVAALLVIAVAFGIRATPVDIKVVVILMLEYSGFFIADGGLCGELLRAFERRDGSVGPDSLQVRMAVRETRDTPSLVSRRWSGCRSLSHKRGRNAHRRDGEGREHSWAQENS